MKKELLLSIALMSPFVAINAENVVTQANSIRYAVKAVVDQKECIYITEEDGSVSLSGVNGDLKWRVASDDPAVAFEIKSIDITGDGDDDLLLASGNGSLYAYSSCGDMLWRFKTPEISRLSEIATIGAGQSVRIFTAGNTFTIYELNNRGELKAQLPVSGCVRSLESGDFVEDGKPALYLHTLAHDKYRSDFFGFIDPTTGETLKNGKINNHVGNGSMVNDLEVADVDGDGRDDVLIFASDNTCELSVVNGELKKIFHFKGKKDKQRYAAAKGVSLLPQRDQIVMQYGGVTYYISSRGEQIARIGEPHKGVIFNEFVWLPQSQTLFGAGQTGGDNTLYPLNVNLTKISTQGISPDGLYAQVEENINTLYKQSLKFKMPEYQSKKEKPFTLLGLPDDYISPQVNRLNGGEMLVVGTSKELSESTPRTDIIAAIGEVGNKRDHRKKYNKTSDEIVAWAAEQERAGNPFQLWVGHGTDPFIIQIATLERIIAAAPNTCRGFIYAEMHDTSDPRVVYFVEEYMPRIAKAIEQNNAVTKLYFRYKNMFWGADAHTTIWRDVFFSKKYSNILVPSAEDTNNRLQDINLSGRVGMYMSGYINDFAMRLVDDNPTSWRPLSQGGQRSVSPYLRAGVLAAAYGSSHGILFNIKYLEKPAYNAFFALVKSGVLPMVDREDILSVGSWHLIQDVDEEHLHSITSTGHNLKKYTPEDDDAVISKAGVQWCGASTSPYDYSRVSLGVKYRWLNFIPAMPNGMVPITSADVKNQFNDYVISDTKCGIVDGEKVKAEEFGTTMAKVVEQGADKMLMRVEGASWALIRVGEKQARLILIDNGYVSPSNKSAEITLQNKMPIKATDVLTTKGLKLKGNTLTVEVPVGSVRFIDFQYDDKI